MNKTYGLNQPVLVCTTCLLAFMLLGSNICRAGSVSGRVTELGDGLGVASIYVTLVQGINTAMYVKTDTNGDYSMSDIPDGSYRVVFSDPDYYKYVTQWYDNAPDDSSAASIDVTAASNHTGINAALVAGGYITGTVTYIQTNEPVMGATVSIYSDTTGSLVEEVTAYGMYSSSVLPPGNYTLSFSNNNTLTTWYNQASDQQAATRVTVTKSGKTAGIDARLLKIVTLSVTLAGAGDGAVNSDPVGIACTSGTCTARYPESSTVKLSATPDNISLFGGWTYACTNQTGDCTVTMTADRAATAAFTPAPKAKVGLSGYDSLAAAYAAAGATDTILALDTEMPDAGFTLDRGKSITLKGGYRNDYTGKSGLPTVLDGLLTIATGSLIVEGLAVR
ncbi:MAG: carboxypeptidase-like regulatory domain-containing protein [Deltaproteobacteria bacterium]|nr:carboxypeptidase-like regulatory domain-containing protein [Deltaproteobacteria bacterium]